MDKENIVQFRYQSNEFLKSESLRSDDFKLQYVDKTNYSDYIPDFHKLLDWIYIHLKTWKNAPTYDEIIKRFQNNSCCVLFYYKEEIIGWGWANTNVSYDFINLNQSLDMGEMYWGGMVISKRIDKPKNSSNICFNMWCEYFFDELQIDVLYFYTDRWNLPALKMFEPFNIKHYNFINE